LPKQKIRNKFINNQKKAININRKSVIFSMNSRAQAGLEYLLTYGWALVLISVVAAILVFVVGSPAGDTTFSSSDPAKVMLKAGSVSGSTAGIILQNITGGRLDVTNSTKSGAFLAASCTLNGLALPTGSSSVEVTGGGEMDVVCSGVSGSSGTISLEYTDYAGLQRQVDISFGGTTAADSSLVAYYAFNESSGTNAADSAGSNDGLLVSFACTTLDCGPNGWVSTGISGNAISFGGTQVVVTAESDTFNFGGGTFTISMWVNPTDRDNIFGLWSIRDYTGGGEYVKTEQTFGAMDGFVFDGSDLPRFDIDYAIPEYLQNGTWYHLVWVVDLTSGWNVKGYKDGTFVDSDSGAEVIDFTGDFWLEIAETNNTNATARIDEVKIYNRALSAAEVCGLCNAFASCGC
jgi:hypothetical protein